MSIAILGRSIERGADPPDAVAFALRADASLAAFDILFVDMDAVFEEFFGTGLDLARDHVLGARESGELLACARRWRERIRSFMEMERLVVFAWQHHPTHRIHTLQDIVEFSVADLLPALHPRIERLPDPAPVQAVAGEPLNAFVQTLDLPFDAGCSISLDPSQPMLATASGRVCACYVYQSPSHLVLTEYADLRGSRALALDAARALAARLGGSGHSEWQPHWVHAMHLPGEEEAIRRLETLEADARELMRQRSAASDRLRSIRRLKSLIAGSPERAASVFSEFCRPRGVNLLADFRDEGSVVIDIDGPVLFLFAAADAPYAGLIEQCEALLDRYRFETDDTALACIVLIGGEHDQASAHAARASGAMPGTPQREDNPDEPIRWVSGLDLIGYLSRDGRSLAAELAQVLELSCG